MSWAEPSNSSLPRNAETCTSRKPEPLLVTHGPPCSLVPLTGPGFSPLPPGALGLMKQWLLISHSRTSVSLPPVLQPVSIFTEPYSLCLWVPHPPAEQWCVIRGDACSFVELLRERNKPGRQEWAALGNHGGVRAESGHQPGVL